MKGIKLNDAIRLLFLILIAILFLTSVYSTSVPKSETIIIPGELNDSLENAQSFDNETEYVFGVSSTPQPKAQNTPNFYTTTNATYTEPKLESWRKTNFKESGTLVITLSYDIDSNYSIEVYNSCSNKNYCEEYEFGTYKTCVMNIQPGNYFFKVINVSGSGKYYLDVDIIKDKQLSEINAWECTQIACTQNQDCGINYSESEKYCKGKDVYQKYNKFNCNNPGKDNATCSTNQKENLVETCNSCFNGNCIDSPTITCPTETINENYSFTWNALEYTSSTSVEFSLSSDFKSKKSVNVKKLTLLPVKNYYSTLVKYETSSKTNKVYARLVGKNKLNKISYSPICEFNLTQKTNSILTCPTEPIDESYIFTLEQKNTVTPKVQISYVSEFSAGKNFQISTKNNQTPITKYYSKLLDYEKKSINKKLYAKVIEKDKYGRDTSSTICEFELKSQVQPILTCPTQGIDSSYFFSWTAGDYQKLVNLEISYKNDFKTKISITATKLNPTPILKYFKTLQKYALKNTTGELYARITAKNNYNQTTTSNICTFKLAGAQLTEKETINQAAYFSISKKTPIKRNTSQLIHTNPTQEINLDTNTSPFLVQNIEQQIIDSNNTKTPINDPVIEVSQQINEDGEIEEIGTYRITDNLQNQYLLLNNQIGVLGSSCISGYTESTTCRSDLSGYNLTWSASTVYHELRYRYIDCTTGEILGKGQMCPGETGPLHHRPDGHTTKFEYEEYICPNNLCRALPIDLCSSVSCSNYCGSNWKYYNGSCSDGICNYSRTLCAAGCDNGSCKTGCTSGCSNYCNGSRLYYNGSCSGSQCNYSSKICTYGCLNGACKSQTCSTGWKCVDDETRAHQNSDCTWDDEEYCYYGCSSGECNDEPISHNYSKCYNNDRYWYNSIDQREGKREDCGENIEENWETPYCNGNTLERKRDIINKYCSSDRCKISNQTETEIIEYCIEGCSNGGCINLPKPGDTDYCTSDKPCQAGVGNCKKNNDCQTGLICVEDVGSKYGYSSNVNVCEAAPNAYTQTGWTCKDPNTMAYLLSDGSYTNEMPCKHGCSNGSCYMPAFCDSSTANLLELPKAQKLSFAGIDSNKEKVKFNAYISENMFSTVIATYALTVVTIVLFETVIIAYNNQVYESINWPEYDDWTSEPNFNQHFNDHKDEFGFKYDYEYRKACEDNYRNTDSITKQQYVENSTQGKVFIVRDAFEEMVSMVNEQGKMIACYMVGDAPLESKLRNKGWTRLPKIPQCIPII